MSEKPTELRKIHIPESIAVHEFAALLEVPATKVIGELMRNGVMATINESIDFDTASIISEEFGVEVELEVAQDERPVQNKQVEGEKKDRPPVVAVMGHVDHGKTSVLDAIRDTEIASREAGGITQHIGAYQVHRKDRMITFLDTPGHEAFSAIRAHGVQVTDVVVIVVAADDGVKPQTKEAVRLAKDAGVGIVVAINKVDKSDADVNRIKQQLSEIELIPDDWGGDTPCVEVSAKDKSGLEALLDMILLVADINKPEAVYAAPASGVIIESHMETGRGATITLLVESGTLKPSDYLVAGSTYGKVRSLENFAGEQVKEATPSMPVVVTGFKAVPAFGDWFEAVPNEKAAREWQISQQRKSSIKSIVKPKSVNASDLARAVSRGAVKELTVIVKADAQGSLESITQALHLLGNDEVQVKIAASGVGGISEGDVHTASATGAIILGFHTTISGAVNQSAKRSGVTFQLYQVIYDLLDDVREWLTALLEPEVVETTVGELELLAIFKTTKDRVICGGKVVKGQAEADAAIQIVREGEVLATTKLVELQKQMQSAQTVLADEECGMAIERVEIAPEVGDTFRFIRREVRERTL
ncbi:MAG: translation initiation factor [Patescibacteria group bacterium]|nr:translation initiation factor [Patescibacteria group bacterium]